MADTSVVNEEVELDQSDTSAVRDDEKDEESSEEESDEDYNPFSDVEEEDTDKDKEPTEHDHLKEDVRMAAERWTYLERSIMIPSVRIEPSVFGDEEKCAVVMSFDASNATEEMNERWDLDKDAFLLSIIVDEVHKWEYRAFDRLPTVLARFDFRQPSIFPLGEILCNAIKPIIGELYSLPENLSPTETGSLFEMLYEVLMDRLNTLNEYCRWCGHKLDGALYRSVCEGDQCQLLNQEKLKQCPKLAGLDLPRPARNGPAVSAPTSEPKPVHEEPVERLEQSTEYCTVCGVKLYEVRSLPPICDSELCRKQQNEMRDHGRLPALIVSPPVLSLLMMTFNAAVNSERSEEILIPAPSTHDVDQLAANIAHLYKNKNRMLDTQGNSGAYEFHKVLGWAMPCAHDVLNRYRKFKKEFPSIAEFIEWLVASNKSILHFVPFQLNVDFLETREQFLCLTDCLSKRAEFAALVKNNGGKTRYLFYGSRMENWHSIIHSGFTNMTGAKYQLSESVNGKRIYLSNKVDAFLSSGFANYASFTSQDISASCWKKGCCVPDLKEKVALVAVVEVVDTPEAYDRIDASMVMAKDEKWCSIRMIVAYHDDKRHEYAGVNLDEMSGSDRKKIQDVVRMVR